MDRDAQGAAASVRYPPYAEPPGYQQPSREGGGGLPPRGRGGELEIGTAAKFGPAGAHAPFPAETGAAAAPASAAAAAAYARDHPFSPPHITGAVGAPGRGVRGEGAPEGSAPGGAFSRAPVTRPAAAGLQFVNNQFETQNAWAAGGAAAVGAVPAAAGAAAGAPLGYSAPFPPANPTWVAPFGAAALAAFGGMGGAGDDPKNLTGAISAAVEAESQVRRGITAAKTWWPATVDSLRSFFAVSHRSVLKKLTAFLLPPVGYYHGVWSMAEGRPRMNSAPGTLGGSGRASRDVGCLSGGCAGSPKGGSGSSLPEVAGGAAEPGAAAAGAGAAVSRLDHLGVDLYLPSMGFVTYVLAFAFNRAAASEFHPELLSSISTFAASLVVGQALAAYAAFFTLGMTFQFLELVAILAQKFVNLLPVVLAHVIASRKSKLYWLAFIYSSVCAAHSTFQSVRGGTFSLRSQRAYWNSCDEDPRKPAAFYYVLLVVALSDVFFFHLLTP